MSTWKIPCTLPGIVPYVFSLLFLVLFITSQVVPNFNTFQLFPCVFFCSVDYNVGGPYVQNISIYFYCFFFCPVLHNEGGPNVQYILFLCPCKYWLGRMLNAHPCLCVPCFPPHGVSSFDILLY